MLNRFCRAFAALVFLIIASAPAAFADLAAFNDAVRKGDYKAAALAAKETWPTLDKSASDITTIAREFGFASYAGGDYAAAKMYGDFLVSGQNGSKADSQAATSGVLQAVAAFKVEPTAKTRDALFVALKSRAAAPGVDNITVLAAEALYKADWNSRSWSNAGRSGALATDLLGRAGAMLAPRAAEAKIASAAAGFLSGADKDDYDALVDAHDALVDAIDTATDQGKRDALVPMMYQAAAWTSSAESYFRGQQQTGSNIPKKVKLRELKSLKTPIYPVPKPGGPECRGDLNWGFINYPMAADFSGTVGTVIIKLDFDDSGRVTKSEVLAAVPMRYFAKAVEDALPTLRVERAKGDAPTCSLEMRDRVLHMSFRIL